jgi:hypothetical protein
MNTILEDGDIDEALSAAHAVGDDAINLKCKVILFRNRTRNKISIRQLSCHGRR